jgi:hypothetical protein
MNRAVVRQFSGFLIHLDLRRKGGSYQDRSGYGFIVSVSVERFGNVRAPTVVGVGAI